MLVLSMQSTSVLISMIFISCIFSKTFWIVPFFDHLLNRIYIVCHLPYLFGNALHLQPFSIMHIVKHKEIDNSISQLVFLLSALNALFLQIVFWLISYPYFIILSCFCKALCEQALECQYKSSRFVHFFSNCELILYSI